MATKLVARVTARRQNVARHPIPVPEALMKKRDVKSAPSGCDPATVQNLYDHGVYLLTLTAFLKMLPDRIEEIESKLLPVLEKQGKTTFRAHIAAHCERARMLAALPDVSSFIDEVSGLGDAVPEGIRTAFAPEASKKTA